ncbi:glycoside hydrolase family 16 protein [Catenuloplanes indicus]|uniref:Beta-glucanase (GH16 family) n=1 Tax=Catenuloplanes indicus TaxID=137267 RepID=A0AAE3W6X1_9ACTN|nr:glycoside hydrolase family 16 protein [Catenuloplanes indicus]MDQ0371068.1 beta-glucanase (GH16 family) [Catenuloplanes indicus]
MRRTRLLLVVGVAAAAALLTTVPLLADDHGDLTVAAVADTTSTTVPQDGDNSVKSTLATCPSTCDRNPRGWRDAVISFDVADIPAGAVDVRAVLRLYSWQAFGAMTSVHLGGSVTGTGVVTRRAAVGAGLDRATSVRSGYNEWDVSGAVAGNGRYTFTVRQEQLGTRVYWASRENRDTGIRPQLTLTYRGGPSGATSAPPAPSPTSPSPSATSDAGIGSAPSTAPPPPPSRTPASTPPVAAGPQAPAGWKLTWSDEFDTGRLDTTKWVAKDDTMVDYDLACITDDNVSVGDDTMVITAQRESATCGSESRKYTTAYLTTQGKKSFTYGRFEIRAKTPTGPGNSTGLWPAFWLRPDDGGVGEIDVVELPGGEDYYHAATQSIFYDYTPVKQDNRYDFPVGYPADGYHTYVTEWDRDELRWYIDGTEVWKRNRSTTPWFTEAFSRPFHLRINFQVGGWLGDPNAATTFPADFRVDYVRVWERS